MLLFWGAEAGSSQRSARWGGVRGRFSGPTGGKGLLKMRKTSLEDAAGENERGLQLLGWMLRGLVEGAPGKRRGAGWRGLTPIASALRAEQC